MIHYFKIVFSGIIALIVVLVLVALFPDPSNLFTDPSTLVKTTSNIINFLKGIVIAQKQILFYHSKQPQFSHVIFNNHSRLIAIIGLCIETMLIVFVFWKGRQTYIVVKHKLIVLVGFLDQTFSEKPYWKLTFLFFICFWIIFRSNETILRKSGFYPGMGYGYVTENGFRHVDSLYTRQYQIADSEGMACFDVQFSFYMDSFRKINKQGFLSAFDYDEQTVDSFRKAGKKIVFVIGDSFVEGVSDSGATTTFIELMRNTQSNYAIFSFGVRGMDPLNYWLTAKRFVEKLRPDLVVVCFCGQNDFMLYDRKLIPGLPLLLHGNAGELTSNIPFNMVGSRDSFLKTYEDAYAFYISQSSLWGKDESGLIAKICRRSSTLTRIYYQFHTPIIHTDTDTSPYDSTVTYRYLHAIDSLCYEYSVPFRVAFIPQGNLVVTGQENNYALNYKKQLGDIFNKTKFPRGFIYDRDYIVPEAHFNVSGNKRFAAYLLDSVIGPVFK